MCVFTSAETQDYISIHSYPLTHGSTSRSTRVCAHQCTHSIYTSISYAHVLIHTHTQIHTPACMLMSLVYPHTLRGLVCTACRHTCILTHEHTCRHMHAHTSMQPQPGKDLHTQWHSQPQLLVHVDMHKNMHMCELCMKTCHMRYKHDCLQTCRRLPCCTENTFYT